MQRTLAPRLVRVAAQQHAACTCSRPGCTLARASSGSSSRRAGGANTTTTREQLRPFPRAEVLTQRTLATEATATAAAPSMTVEQDQEAPPPPRTAEVAAEQSETAAHELGPAEAYELMVRKGTIRDDAHQREIVDVLQDMYVTLKEYSPPTVDQVSEASKQAATPTPTLMSKLFGGKGEQELSSAMPMPVVDVANTPKGLYLYGDVGCGKSFLMDLFYAHVPTKFANKKRRVHFHAFMVDVHKRGHLLRSSGKAAATEDWIVPVARDLAQQARVLCFDEFQVTDIADAMILKRLMQALMGYGVVAVMTSNRVPDDLYKNGIQREQFIPCIELIKDRFKVQCLDSNVDYRKLPRALSNVYYSPLSAEKRSEVDKLWDAQADEGRPEVHDRKITVWGRPVRVPLSIGDKAARFSFHELCGQPFSAADYIEITKTFGTIFLVDVPQLTMNERDQARRLITFIDAAYEAKTKLFVLSDPPVQQIFSDQRSAPGEISAHQRSIMDDLGLSAEAVGASSIFSGDEEIFAFARAVSRITEMGSLHWAQHSRAAHD